MVKYYAQTSKDFPKTGMNTLTSQLKLTLLLWFFYWYVDNNALL